MNFLLKNYGRNASKEKRVLLRFFTSKSEVVYQGEEKGSAEIGIGAEERIQNVIEAENDDLKSRIFRLRLPKRSVMNVLHRWVSEGRQITMPDLRDISKELRKSQRYKHALEVAFCPQFSNSLLVLFHFCSNFDFSCTLLTLVISSN